MKTCCSWLHSTLFKKSIVAVTGLFLVGFLFAHMLGNLQVFAGQGPTPETTKMNEYAAFLKKEVGLLWAARVFLLTTLMVHVLATISLVRHNRKARPVRYENRQSYANAPSRMMFYAGLAIFAYTVYHIMHFTTATVHSDLFHPTNVYQNVIRSFQNPWIAIVYIVAQGFLFLHLYHGVLSLFRTLGFYKPHHIVWIRRGAISLSVIICGGFIAVPLSVWLGLIQ